MRYWPHILRAKLGLSQKRFGNQIGISPWRLSEIERGSPIRKEELAKIIEALQEVAFHEYKPIARLRLE